MVGFDTSWSRRFQSDKWVVPGKVSSDWTCPPVVKLIAVGCYTVATPTTLWKSLTKWTLEPIGQTS